MKTKKKKTKPMVKTATDPLIRQQQEVVYHTKALKEKILSKYFESHSWFKRKIAIKDIVDIHKIHSIELANLFSMIENNHPQIRGKKYRISDNKKTTKITEIKN